MPEHEDERHEQQQRAAQCGRPTTRGGAAPARGAGGSGAGGIGAGTRRGAAGVGEQLGVGRGGSASTSSTSTTTTLVLSSPPARFAASTSSSAARCGSGSLRSESLDVAFAHHGGEPVGAEQDAVAGRDLDRVEVDLDLGVDAERARDDRRAAGATRPARG